VRNPLNGSWGSWQKHARTAKAWRERTAQHVLAFVVGPPRMRRLRLIPARTPKTVTFTVHTWNRWDQEEGIPAACKPLRDGLVDAGVLHSDAHDCGHTFRYAQVMDRARRGVEITVEPT
jgi:hypothetical protein